MAFIDYRKFLGSAVQKFLLQALKNQGFQDKYSTIIRIIYNHSHEKIKMDSEEEKFKLEREGKQCDPISPQVFTCLLEHIFRKVNCCNKTSLNCNVINQNKWRYADDIALFASSSGEMQEMVNEPTKLSTDVGLQIDTKNTKAITNRAAGEIKLKGENLEYVPE